MKKFRAYVTFKPEDTKATEYLSISQIVIEVHTKEGDMHSTTYNVSEFLRTMYSDRAVESIAIYAAR